MRTARNWTMYFAVPLTAIAVYVFVASDKPLFSAPPSELTLGGLPDDAILVVGSGEIDVEGGTIPLSLSVIGDVEEILVKEDQHVTAGTPLVRLRSVLAKQNVAQAEAAVARAEVGLEQAKRAPADHKLRVQLQEHAIAASQARLEAQQRQVDKLERLLKINATADENLRSAQDQLREGKIQVDAEDVRIEQLKLERPAEAISIAESALADAKAQLAIAREQLARHTLVAPVDGIVLRVLVGPGETLGAQQREPAVWFCPNKPRIVRCEIEQEFANSVTPGMRADVYLDGDDSTVCGGTVLRCSEWIARRRYLPEDPTLRIDARTMECLVQLDPKESPLRIGQQVRVVLRAPGRPNPPAREPSVAASPLAKSSG
ncbi:MAG: biotin/lipoyl-binding protein [Planctomycetota bacterium]